MPLLFSYGTLQHESVQLSTLGRRLNGERDELPGFEPSLVRIEDPQVAATTGKTHHANVKFNGNEDSRVPGMVFEVTDAEFASVDEYEVASLYKRVAARLASGRQAWVYVHAHRAPETERLEEQLRLSFEGGAWHGPAVLEALAGVSPEAASAHPMGGAHSIWELALHLTGTYRLVLRRLSGDGTQLTPQEDWPAVPAVSSDNWTDTIETLRRLNRELRSAVRSFPTERLDDPLVAEAPYSAFTQFIGITQHDLYHAGQIALVKRSLRLT